MNTIEFDDFLRIELCTGTITEAKLNPKARQASYILSIDFGEKGTQISSAQLTADYAAEELVGKQIVAVMNFAPKRIAGVQSKVLVLGAMCPDHGVVLLEPLLRWGMVCRLCRRALLLRVLSTFHLGLAGVGDR